MATKGLGNETLVTPFCVPIQYWWKLVVVSDALPWKTS